MKNIVAASVTALVIAALSACAGEDAAGGADETSNQPFIVVRDAQASAPDDTPIAVPPTATASAPTPPIERVTLPYPRPRPDPVPMPR